MKIVSDSDRLNCLYLGTGNSSPEQHPILYLILKIKAKAN